MKKLLSLLVVTVALFSIVGCSSTKESKVIYKFENNEALFSPALTEKPSLESIKAYIGKKGVYLRFVVKDARSLGDKYFIITDNEGNILHGIPDNKVKSFKNYPEHLLAVIPTKSFPKKGRMTLVLWKPTKEANNYGGSPTTIFFIIKDGIIFQKEEGKLLNVTKDLYSLEK